MARFFTLCCVAVAAFGSAETAKHSAHHPTANLATELVKPANPTAKATTTKNIYPADAAFHERSSQWPQREAHMLTQNILNSIHEKKDKASGMIATREAHFEMAFEYSIGLHRDLVSLDNLEVIGFDHSDKFAVRNLGGGIIPGSLLVGSHLGKWSFTAGSKHAILKESKDANEGGIAYLRRVVSVVNDDDDGISHVETAKVEEGDAANLFPRGNIALGYNHTKTTRQRIDTDALDERASGEIISRIPAELKPDDHADMSHDRRLGYISTFCDGQCQDNSWLTGYDYLTDDENEACIYCFQSIKTVDLFKFNYDGSGAPPGSNALTSPLYPHDSYQFIRCTDCYAYLGGSVWILADWGDRTAFDAGLSGQAGYNFNLEFLPGSATLSYSKELFRKDTCLPTIDVGGYLTIGTNCALKSIVSGTVDWDADVTLSSYLDASATFGGGYTNGVWSTSGASTWDYEKPTGTIGFTSGTAEISASIYPFVEITAAIGIAGTLTLNFQCSVGIQPTLSLKAESARRRKLLTDSGFEATPVTLANVATPDELPMGGTLKMVVDLESDANVVFKVASSCWKENLELTLLTTFLPSGRSNVAVPIPWNILFVESPCEDYKFTAFRAASPHAVSAVDIRPSNASGPCQNAALVSSPSDGDVISPKGLLTVVWDPKQMFFMRGSDEAPNGKMVEAENVTIQIIGTTSFQYDDHQCFGENHSGACVETTTVTPVRVGVPNTGSFAFDLSTNTDGEGNMLPWAGSLWQGRYSRVRVKVIASDHWFTWGYNRGWFALGDGEASEIFCGASTTSTPVVARRLNDLIAHSSSTSVRDIVPQRGLAQVLLTTGYSLDGFANFDRVYIDASLTMYDLWEDTTAIHDISAPLIPSVNWYQGYIGSVDPTTCDAGEFPSSSTSCESCSGGKYSTDGTICTSCPAGRYGSSTGLTSSSCTSSCPAGQYSTAGALACTNAVMVEVTWVMDASAPPTDSDKATLKAKVATQLGIDETTGIKNFAVTSQAASLRRLNYQTTEEDAAAQSPVEQQHRRRLTEAWTVVFDLVSTSDAAEAAASTVVAELSDPTFEAAVQAAIPNVQSFAVPVAMVMTQSPSPGPSPQHVPSPAASASLPIVILGTVGGLFGLCFITLVAYSVAKPKPGSVAEFLRNKVKISSARAVALAEKFNKPSGDNLGAASGTEANATSEVALSARIPAKEAEMTTMVRGPALENKGAEASKPKPGSVAEFLRNKVKISSARAVALAEKFSEHGYEMAADFKGLSEEETVNLLQMKIGLLVLEIRKFRRAVEDLNNEPKDVEAGDPSQEACMALLEKCNLVEIYSQIKAEAGGSISVENLCNPDLVSDAVLLGFGLNKIQIGRYRRAVRQHQGVSGEAGADAEAEASKPTRVKFEATLGDDSDGSTFL